jgi:hypothetical protein
VESENATDDGRDLIETKEVANAEVSGAVTTEH